MGPSSKADCLNRLYRALRADEARMGWRARSILLHDAEDMVDAAALPLIDQAMADCDFVQIPVLPEPQAGSRWIAGHYSDEFAEAHGKAMVVREALSAALPAAGVGCAFSHDALDRLANDPTPLDTVPGDRLRHLSPSAQHRHPRDVSIIPKSRDFH